MPCAIIIVLSLINILNPFHLFDQMGQRVYLLAKRNSTSVFNRSESLRVLRKVELQKEYYEVNELFCLLGLRNLIHGQDIARQTL